MTKVNVFGATRLFYRQSNPFLLQHLAFNYMAAGGEDFKKLEMFLKRTF